MKLFLEEIKSSFSVKYFLIALVLFFVFSLFCTHILLFSICGSFLIAILFSWKYMTVNIYHINFTVVCLYYMLLLHYWPIIN